MNKRINWKAQIAIGLVCAALTFAIATQLSSVRQNTANESIQAQRTEELQIELGKEREKNADLSERLTNAQNDLQQYRDEAENSSDYAKILSQQLQRSELLAGLTEVQGPGIVVTVSDSTAQAPDASTTTAEMLLIHDSDLRLIVTELNAAGAEALSINGERIISTTAIRCVGPVINVNEQKMAPPYEISAIGDPKTLEAAVNMRGGLKDVFSAVGIEVAVRTEDKLSLPRYSGLVNFKYAEPVTEESEGEE